jgi:small subunit ribosomal protein S13
MPRIQGVDIPNDKRILISLQYLYGVGASNSKWILEKCGIDPNVRARDLTEDEVARIAGEIEANYVVEGQLRRQIAQNVQRLKDINSYRGYRHKKGLPTRGQRTKTNARTRKGPRRTVAVKKSVKAMRS